MSDSVTGKRTLENAETPAGKRAKLESFPVDEDWKKAEEADYLNDSEFVPEEKPEEEEAEDELEFVEEVEQEEAESDEEEESIEELDEDAGEELGVQELQDILALSEMIPDGIDLDDSTLKAIQQVAKDYMAEVFENAQLIASNIGKRDYVTEEDVKVAVQIMKKTTQNLPSHKLDMAAL